MVDIEGIAVGVNDTPAHEQADEASAGDGEDVSDSGGGQLRQRMERGPGTVLGVAGKHPVEKHGVKVGVDGQGRLVPTLRQGQRRLERGEQRLRRSQAWPPADVRCPTLCGGHDARFDHAILRRGIFSAMLRPLA